MPKISLNISDDVYAEIEKFAQREHVSKTEAMRRVLSLMKVSNAENAKGHSLGIIDDQNGKPEVVAKLIGV